MYGAQCVSERVRERDEVTPGTFFAFLPKAQLVQRRRRLGDRHATGCVLLRPGQRRRSALNTVDAFVCLFLCVGPLVVVQVEVCG